MPAREAFSRLVRGEILTKEEILALLFTEEFDEEMRAAARAATDAVFGKNIYLRGLIEISSFCKNDCLYCGLRKSNEKAARYRLSEEEILSAAASGYREGIRTFVLQGGEDGYFTDDRLVSIIKKLKARYRDAAITLSLGERSYASYEALRAAGADRYLLRHETATPSHYAKLHPSTMELSTRLACLGDLKALGYQVGAGFMVGSPYQTMEHIAEDLLFLQDFQPHMIGIGPFLPQKETPFGKEAAGSLSLTLKLLSMVRLMHKRALLPATTALATLSKDGRERGILGGANVVMPNLSPETVRGQYAIYDNKAAEPIGEVRQKIEALGYTILSVRGDYK